MDRKRKRRDWPPRTPFSPEELSRWDADGVETGGEPSDDRTVRYTRPDLPNRFPPTRPPVSSDEALARHERVQALVNRVILFNDRLEREGITWEPDKNALYGVDEKDEPALRSECTELADALSNEGLDICEVLADIDDGRRWYDPGYDEPGNPASNETAKTDGWDTIEEDVVPNDELEDTLEWDDSGDLDDDVPNDELPDSLDCGDSDGLDDNEAESWDDGIDTTW